jgi:hypothetical protein
MKQFLANYTDIALAFQNDYGYQSAAEFAFPPTSKLRAQIKRLEGVYKEA